MKIKTLDKNNNTINPFFQYETNVYDILNNLLKNNFIVKKTNDGCKCDMYVKLKNNNNKWLKIQLKSSKFNGRLYSFALHNNKYTNMLVICYHLIDKKMWIIDGDKLPQVNKLTIGKKTSIYNKYIVNIENITETIIDYYKSFILFDEKEILEQMSRANLIEHEHRIKRENKLKNIVNIKYPKNDNMVYDVLINNHKVQDKAGRKKTKNGNDYYEFVIKKSKNNKKWYNKNDNDFYWFYNKFNNMFLLIPEKELIKHNYINYENNKNKLMSSFTINFENITTNKFSNYVFDYNKLDINKISKLFE